MQRHSVAFGVLCVLMRGLHGLKLKPEPGPYPKYSPPPPPQRIANKKKKAAFHDCMQWSVNKHTKKQIHHGLAISQNKNTYQLGKLMNIRCSGRIHSAEFMNGWRINNLFEWERERKMKVACACETASARLSLQAMRLSYFKNSDVTSSLQKNITLRVSSLSELFY